MNIKEKYNNQVDRIAFSEDFEQRTAELMKKTDDKKENIFMIIKKPVKTVIAIAAIIAVFSVSAFAALNLLPIDKIAERLGYTVSEHLINNENDSKSVTDKGYTVTLHGVLSASELKSAIGNSDSRYIVVSVAKSDGSELNIIDGCPITIRPLIKGYAPWNSPIEGRSESFEEDGVLYYIFAFDNLMEYSESSIYIAAYDSEIFGFAPNNKIFKSNSDGSIEFADGYKGFKALFTLG